MSDPIILALIAGIPPTLASLSALIISLRNGKKVDEVHKATNSMKDALVKAALIEGHAAGVAEEKARKK